MSAGLRERAQRTGLLRSRTKNAEVCVAIPLLQYAPITQNARVAALRVASDEVPRSNSMDIAMDADNLSTVIESAYRQIYFHAFESDRDVNLESQLRDGQITVRDFVRGLCLSDTFKRSFYGMNSNYKVVRHLVEKLLGRKTGGKSEEISWSILIATKGIEGMVDALLDSQEYLDNFGYDSVPFQRNRVIPGKELGDTPSTSPAHDTTSTTEEFLAFLSLSIQTRSKPKPFLPEPKSSAAVSPRIISPGLVVWPIQVGSIPKEVWILITSPRFPIAASVAEFQEKFNTQKRGAATPFLCIAGERPQLGRITTMSWSQKMLTTAVKRV